MVAGVNGKLSASVHVPVEEVSNMPIETATVQHLLTVVDTVLVEESNTVRVVQKSVLLEPLISEKNNVQCSIITTSIFMGSLKMSNGFPSTEELDRMTGVNSTVE